MTSSFWRLRELMEQRGFRETSQLRPLLAERGVALSREQVFRLVKHPPERLSMRTLGALCDILGCTPNDLIELSVPIAAASTPRTKKRTKPLPPSLNALEVTIR